jgi:hypothetical protein
MTPAALAAMRERHMPQMCMFVASSTLSQLALISIPGDDGASVGAARSSAGSGLDALFGGFGLGPVGPTVPIPGLGDVPVGAIVVLLLTMVLGILAVRAKANEGPGEPAFLRDVLIPVKARNEVGSRRPRKVA